MLFRCAKTLIASPSVYGLVLKPIRSPLMATLLVLSGAVATPAHAVLWNVYGGLSLETEYSDNKRLSVAMPDEGFQTVADVDINAARVKRNNQFLAHAEFEAVRYDGIEILNNEENALLRLSGQHKPTRTFSLGWFGQYARDTTSNRQPRAGSQVDENSDFDVDTGLTREQFRTKELSFGPSAAWQLSEQLRLKASYTYREVSFPDRATTDFNFFDHDQHRVQISADYAFTDRQTFTVSASASTFESMRRLGEGTSVFAAEDVETDTIGGSLGYRYDFSKTLYLGVVAGVQKVDTKFESGLFDGDDTEFVYRVFAVSRGNTSRLLVSFGRSIEGSGVGRLIESNLARLVYSYRLAPRQTFRLRASYLSNKPIGNAQDRLDREFFAVEPGYNYAVSRQLSVGVNYRYRTRELRVEETKADNHSVSLNLKYRFGQE